jgi:glycosyltransferase involved in cell wall biosynthesis
LKKKILLFADWYEPGYRAGGPIRSCVNFAQHMKKDYEVYVFTSDRDLGATAAYEGIPVNAWIIAEPGLHLYYSSLGHRGKRHIEAQIREIAPDFIYLNSMFSLHFTLFPLWIARLAGARRPRIILSPRGMLRVSALRYKPLKKKIFLTAFRLLHFPSIIHFLAADEEEKKDIGAHFGRTANTTQIPNLPAVLVDEPAYIIKESGRLSMIFVGRIHPIKNLDYLLGLLTPLSANIRLTIVGSLEDKEYWQQCNQVIHNLPPAINIQYLGEIPNDRIAGLIKEHHIFALPTQGENFGHAIFESLSSKRPVLISDQTPWRRLSAAKAGWEVPLQQPAEFQQAILQAVAWNQAEFDEWAEGAFRFACAHRDNSGAIDRYRQLFS